MDKAKSYLLELMKYNTSSYPQNAEMYDNCAAFISSLFDELGFEFELIQTASGKIILCKHLLDDDFPHIHFNGHYDVVPATDNETAHYDKKTNIFWGRGCSDMKAGIISIWLACKNVIERGIPCNISISFSPDEETGGKIASRKIMEIISGFLPKEALIVIADSSHPYIITSHRGAYWLDVTISLESTQRFASQLSAFEIMCKYYPEFIKTPHDKVGVVIGGVCKSSNAVNLWAHTVNFSLDYRFEESCSVSDIQKWIACHFPKLNALIASDLALNADPLTWTSLLEVDPCVCKADYTDYLVITKSIIPTASIDNGRGFYDLRYFRDAGFINSFVLGPGDILNAHVKEETLNAQNMEDCSLAYIKFIEGVANGK